LCFKIGVEKPHASKAARKLLELRPLLSQSDVHQFIERVITENSLDLADIYTSCDASSSDRPRIDLRDQSISLSNTSQCMPGASRMMAESHDITSRPTLQEIDPNKQLVSLGQTGVVFRHLDEVGVDASAELCSGKNNLDEMQECTEVKNVATSDELEAKVSVPNPGCLQQSSKLDEVNNNHRYTSQNIPQRGLVDSNCSPKLGLRKSKRCNRGQRYKELVSQGVLHQSRKRQEVK
jgi:hypothetical protein